MFDSPTRYQKRIPSRVQPNRRLAIAGDGPSYTRMRSWDTHRCQRSPDGFDPHHPLHFIPSSANGQASCLLSIACTFDSCRGDHLRVSASFPKRVTVTGRCWFDPSHGGHIQSFGPEATDGYRQYVTRRPQYQRPIYFARLTEIGKPRFLKSSGFRVRLSGLAPREAEGNLVDLISSNLIVSRFDSGASHQFECQ